MAKYTKTQAKRALLSIEQKSMKLYESNYMTFNEVNKIRMLTRKIFNKHK